MNKIENFIKSKPWFAAAIILAVGGILALSFAVVRKFLQPAANAVSKVTGGS